MLNTLYPRIGFEYSKIRLVANGEFSSGGTGATVTVPNVKCSGKDNILQVLISDFDSTLLNRSVQSMTFRGKNLIKKRADEIQGAGGQRSEIWYLLNPNRGTGNLVITMGGGTPFVDVAWQCIEGVDQVVPFIGEHSSSSSADLFFADHIAIQRGGAWLFSVCALGNGPATPGVGQFKILDQSGSTSVASYKRNLAIGHQSTTYRSTAVSDAYVISSVVLNPSRRNFSLFDTITTPAVVATIFSKVWGIKPVNPVLNKNHPLAKDLVAVFLVDNQSGNIIRNLISPQDRFDVVGSGVLSTNYAGKILDASLANDSGAFNSVIPQILKLNQKVSIFWQGYLGPSPTAFSQIVGAAHNNTDTDPFMSYGIHVSDVANNYQLPFNADGTFTSVNIPAKITFDGTERQLVGTIQSGEQKFYENAVNIFTGSTTFTAINYNADATFGIGLQKLAHTRNSKTKTSIVYIWKRVINATEVEQLYQDPYAIFRKSVLKSFARFLVKGTTGTLFTQTLSESTTITASLFKQDARTLSQTISLTASMLRSMSRTLSQTITNTATLLKQDMRTLSQSISLTATFTSIKTQFKTLSETLTLISTLIKQASRTLSQTLTLTPTFLGARLRFTTLSDTISLTATLIKTPSKVLTQTITLTSSMLRTIARTLSQTITLTATALKQDSRTLSQSITLTATFTSIKTQFKTLSETLSLTASLIRQVTRTLLQTVTLTPTLTTFAGKVRSFSETLTLTASLLKKPGKVLTETLSVTASLIRNITRTFTQTITLTASFLSGIVYGRIFTATLHLTDSFLHSSGKFFTETLTIKAKFYAYKNGVSYVWTKAGRVISGVWRKIAKPRNS